MITRIVLLFALLAPLFPAAAATDSLDGWEDRVVALEVNRQEYQLMQPWARSTARINKVGIVIDDRRILTSADQMNDLTLVRVQKGGRGRWYDGRLEWVDYHANLALVTCAEDDFWTGLSPASLLENIPLSGEVRLLRWREGKLEARKLEINRPVIETGKLTFIDLMHLELDGDVSGIGWAEPVVNDEGVVGLVVSSNGSGGSALPAPFIRSVLRDQENGDFRGLGFFNFYWQRAENPATLQSLGLTDTDRGVVVINAMSKVGEESVLKARDVILRIAGHDIDVHGDYLDPVYGQTMLEAIPTQDRRAGDEVPMTIWRDGREMEVDYRLPEARFEDELVPDQLFDQAPQYLIAGGLVFQPLSVPYLRSWGAEWNRRAPFKLAYAEQRSPTTDQPSIVILSLVLPDPFNLGYQDARYLIVSRINDREIVTLHDVEAALENPVDGFHRIEFSAGDSPRFLVLDADQLPGATGRVLQRYGIQSASYIIADE